MDASRHQRLAGLFAQFRRLDAVERNQRIDALRADDAALADELATLLRHGERAPVSSADAGLGLGALFAGFDPLRAAEERVADERMDALASAPSTIGRYTILRELGEGGMGVVYLAEQDRPRRVVALKLMRQGFGRDATRLRRRFELETQVLGRLEHPGIARIYDAGTATMDRSGGAIDVPYFAMEYVDGRSLVEHAEHEGLGTRERMALMSRICDAVAAAHRQGVVHRDLKPGNILVDRTGNPKILDFGVARATDSDVAVTTMHTDVGQLVGTLPYMSPEQVEGDPTQLDLRCDVYALGVVAYELLSGRLPLEVRGMSVAQAARVIRDEDPTPLSAVNRLFRGDLETIVAKSLEKDRARRYGSADELRADIDRYLREEPIVARPSTTMYHLRKFARRNRGLVAGIVAAFVVLLLGLGGTTWGLLQANRQRIAARLSEASANEQRNVAVAAEKLATEQRNLALAAQALAQKRFNEVHRLANKFIYDVHDGIVDLPGSTKVRKEIVETALTYLDALATESTDDRKLQGDLAEAYLKVGMAQGYYSRGNLGDREGARASFSKALGIRAALVAADPDDLQALTHLVSARNQVGNIDYSEGRFDEALAAFRAGLEVRQRILDRTPEGAPERRAALRAVAISSQWVGNVLMALDRPDDALPFYRRQVELAEQVIAAEDTAGAQRDLSVAREKIGECLSEAKRYEEAIEHYRASMAIRERLAAATPDSVEARLDVAVSMGKIGNRLMRLGRVDEAAPLLVRSHDIGLELAATDPANVHLQTSTVVAKTWLGELEEARAGVAGVDAETRAAHLDAAIGWLRAALDQLGAMKAAGTLEPRYESWFTEIGGAKEKLEAQRAETGAPESAASRE